MVNLPVLPVIEPRQSRAGQRIVLVPLKANLHQEADDTRPIKQRDVWPDVTGAGRINVIETMKQV